ncbi:glycosyltransferase [Micromonospora chokoriensis]
MIAIVVPTVGRTSLTRLLEALAEQVGDRDELEILLVDDRSVDGAELTVPGPLAAYTKVLRGRGAGPAAARNLGWRATRQPWIAFLDDDVVPAPGWFAQLVGDLAVPGLVGGVQGRIRVPLPRHRRPTDWERSTAALADGRWITADMAYRRAALAAVGGFDERFPRAYREDAELAHRVRRAGWHLVRGTRTVTHPVRAEGRWVSLRTQRGNADDALLRRLYGPRWRTEIGVPAGRRRRHVAVAAAGALATTAVLARLALPTPVSAARTGGTRARRLLAVTALTSGAGWMAGTASFARERIAPGPRDSAEISAMLVTSALIPPLAVGHWLAGRWRARVHRPYGSSR